MRVVWYIVCCGLVMLSAHDMNRHEYGRVVADGLTVILFGFDEVCRTIRNK